MECRWGLYDVGVPRKRGIVVVSPGKGALTASSGVAAAATSMPRAIAVSSPTIWATLVTPWILLPPIQLSRPRRPCEPGVRT